MLEDTQNVKEMDVQLCRPCYEYDCTENKAEAFCFQCLDYLCTDCVKEHNKNKMTRNHSIGKNGEIPNNSRVLKDLEKLMFCHEHPSVEITHICNDHSAYLCVHCTTTVHKQCNGIKDINTAKLESVDKVCLVASLNKDISMAQNVITSKTSNIESLEMDGIRIDKERKQVIQNFTENIVRHLQKLEATSRKQTKQMIKEEQRKLEEDVKRLETIEQELELFFELAQTIVKHGSKALQRIAIETVRKRSDLLALHIQRDFNVKVVRIKFEKNKLFPHCPELGHISVINDSIETGQQCLADVSSDEVMDITKDVRLQSSPKSCTHTDEKCTNRETDRHKDTKVPFVDNRTNTLKPIPETCISARERYKNTETDGQIVANVSFMNMELNEGVTLWKVRTPDDRQQCYIVGIFTFPKDVLLVLDRRNLKVKVFHQEVPAVKERLLSAMPQDACKFGVNCIAIIYVDVSHIDIFEVKSETGEVQFAKQIKVEGYPSSITCNLDGDLMLLFAQENTQIHIYDTDGFILRRITKFEDQHNKVKPLKNVKYINFTPLNKLVTSQQDIIRAFGPGCINPGSEIITQAWFYKANGGNILREAGKVATDSEGNMYVCEKTSRSIHQIFNKNLWKDRILLELKSVPTSVHVDEIRSRLLVACENDDNLHVCQFV